MTRVLITDRLWAEQLPWAELRSLFNSCRGGSPADARDAALKGFCTPLALVYDRRGEQAKKKAAKSLHVPFVSAGVAEGSHE